jgi:hypothetical protein
MSFLILLHSIVNNLIELTIVALLLAERRLQTLLFDSVFYRQRSGTLRAYPIFSQFSLYYNFYWGYTDSKLWERVDAFASPSERVRTIYRRQDVSSIEQQPHP